MHYFCAQSAVQNMSATTMTRTALPSSAASVSGRSHVHAQATRPTACLTHVNSRSRTVDAKASFGTGGWAGGWNIPSRGSYQSSRDAWRSSQAQTAHSHSRCHPCGPGYHNSSDKPNSSSRLNSKPSLRYDVIQSGTTYQLFIDIPGLAKPDLKIRVSNPKSDKVQGSSPCVLTISGERQAPLQEGYVQKQRLFGGFENVWELPADAESDGISAKVTDGVLTVTVPKKQQQPEQDDSQEIFIS